MENKKKWTKGVPIEVVPMTYKVVIKALENKLSIKPQQITLRMVISACRSTDIQR